MEKVRLEIVQSGTNKSWEYDNSDLIDSLGASLEVPFLRTPENKLGESHDSLSLSLLHEHENFIGSDSEPKTDQIGASLEGTYLHYSLSELLGDSLGDCNISIHSVTDISHSDHETAKVAAEKDTNTMKSVFDFTSDSDSNSSIGYVVETSTPLKKKRSKTLEHAVSTLSPIKVMDSKEYEGDAGNITESLQTNTEALSRSSFSYEMNETEHGGSKTYMKARSNSLLKKAVSTASDAVKNRRDCPNSCLAHFSIGDVKNARYNFWTKSYQHRVEWMLEKLDERKLVQGEEFYNVSKGRYVCNKCLCALCKINKNFFFNCRKKNKKGDTSVRNRNGRSRSNMMKEAESWLEMYAKSYGDEMPDRKETQLPYKYRKISVYRKYAAEKKDMLQQCIAQSTFLQMWKKCYPWLKIKKTNSFSKCDKCTALNKQLEKTRDAKKRAEIKLLVDAHNERQMSERRYYYSKREQAKRFPQDYLSIIIDGMDQSKTNLPHFTGRKSKCLDAAYILKTHIQGVLNHGRDTFSTFVDINEYSHDANMVMNTLLRTLKDSVQTNKLPAILYLQADNCYRENKNKYVFGLCDLLVRMQIFSEVHISFLYVGHTHEDIDAAFSTIADKLRRNDAETLVRLLDLLPGSNRLQGLYNIKAWLEPHLNNITKHSKPLHFRFRRAFDGGVEGSYKGQNNKPWILMEEEVLNSIPAGEPNVLLPDHLENINFNELEQTIDKCQHLIMENSSRNWWRRFIAEMKAITTSPALLEGYATRNAEWILPKLPKVNVEAPLSMDVVPDHVHEMLDKELDIPNVQVRQRRRKKHTNKDD